MPASNAVKELFAQARAAGLGEQDFSALFGFLVGRESSEA
jgi:3-hydroxyisobutyrate dehydrogenase-like beta-hydroxyacid dehydrogenase